MDDVPCKDRYGIFGAGRPEDARPDEAAELCATCDIRNECLEQFSANNRPEHVPYMMTVAGLTDERLRRAMRLVRENAA